MDEIDHMRGKFDLVTCNMVIHHLDSDFENYPNFRKALNSLQTFLKPGGKVCINHFMEENLDSVWHFCLHPEAAKHYFAKFPPRKVMLDAYKEAGLLNF
jgi:SAM-dependent methyltransferase